MSIAESWKKKYINKFFFVCFVNNQRNSLIRGPKNWRRHSASIPTCFFSLSLFSRSKQFDFFLKILGKIKTFVGEKRRVEMEWRVEWEFLSCILAFFRRLFRAMCFLLLLAFCCFSVGFSGWREHLMAHVGQQFENFKIQTDCWRIFSIQPMKNMRIRLFLFEN